MDEGKEGREGGKGWTRGRRGEGGKRWMRGRMEGR